MKLRQNIVMYLLLIVLLLAVVIGLLLRNTDIDNNANTNSNTNPNSSDVIDNNENVEKPIPETFCKEVTDSDSVPSDVLKVITDYMDEYYRSMYTLEQVPTASYFCDDVQAAISEYSIKLIIESRKLYGDDFKLDDAYYVLNIKNCSEVDDNEYLIEVLEDDYLYFKCLDGISSETIDVDNIYRIKLVDTEYKIESLMKEQSQNIVFDENEVESVDEVVDIYEHYFENLKYTFDKENSYRNDAQRNPYVASKKYEVKFNGDAAAKYASDHYLIRNENYADFSDGGGNCQNMAGQALIAGGMIMDEVGDYQWYYNNSSDSSYSWRTVKGFGDYVEGNDGHGMVAEKVANIYYAEPGDIVHVGHRTSLSHATVVTKIVNGHILLSSNSIDMKDFPLEAYIYSNRKLIKILGYNS